MKSFEQTANLEHLKLAWQWHLATPKFLTLSCGFKAMDEKKFVAKLTKGLNWIGYEDNIPKALIYGEALTDGAIQGHLYNERGTSIELVGEIVEYAKNEALKSYDKVVLEIASKHRTLHTLVKQAGFSETGLYKMNVLRNRQFITEIFVGV